MKNKTGNTTFKNWTYFANSTTLFSSSHRSNLQKRRENRSPTTTGNSEERHIESLTLNDFFARDWNKHGKGLGTGTFRKLWEREVVGICVFITQTVCLTVEMDRWQLKIHCIQNSRNV